MQNNVFNPCDIYSVTIVSKNGAELDLIAVFNQIDIYEDIFTHFIQATLSLKDTNDMMRTFPIIGGEKVIISFKDHDEGGSKWLDFSVVEVMPQPQITDENRKSNFMILRLISEDSINGNLIRFSKKFEDTMFGIMNEVLAVNLNSVTLVESSTSADTILNFVANYWNLDELIDYMCSQSMDTMFFQTIDGYRIEKLSYLVAQKPIQKFRLLTDLEDKGSSLSVFQYKFDKHFNITKSFNVNAFGKTVYKPSLENYSFEKEEKKLEDIYDEYPLMGANQPLLKALSTETNQVSVDYLDLDSALKRNLILQTLQNYNLVVQMNGSVGRRVGDVVVFNVPSFNNSIINEHYQYNWLILQIHHIIGCDKTYKQVIRLFKNAFFNNTKVG
jgi:hypothetical protein